MGRSTSAGAPFGLAIRSGIPQSQKLTSASVGVPLAPGTTVESISFSFRQVYTNFDIILVFWTVSDAFPGSMPPLHPPHAVFYWVPRLTSC